MILADWFTSLHPAVQVTLIVAAAAVLIAVIWVDR